MRMKWSEAEQCLRSVISSWKHLIGYVCFGANKDEMLMCIFGAHIRSLFTTAVNAKLRRSATLQRWIKQSPRR